MLIIVITFLLLFSTGFFLLAILVPDDLPQLKKDCCFAGWFFFAWIGIILFFSVLLDWAESTQGIY